MKPDTVIFTAADGKQMALPLDALISRGAIIATRVNGCDIRESFGARNQLMIPGLPAKYFIRDIVDISFVHKDNPPQLPEFIDDGRDYTNRPNISMSAPFSVQTNTPIAFHGWANDFDRKIISIEISLDQGDTWSRCSTQEASAEKLVWWDFEFIPQQVGEYTAMARAVNEDGKKSPIPAIHNFEVTI